MNLDDAKDAYWALVTVVLVILAYVFGLASAMGECPFSDIPLLKKQSEVTTDLNDPTP